MIFAMSTSLPCFIGGRVRRSACDERSDGRGRGSSPIVVDVDQVPVPPFFGVKVHKDFSLDTLYGFINETALFKNQWQLKTASATDVKDLFHQKYRGSRYSLGYPACANLEHQAKIFALLMPEENIGVRLTEGYHLEPEQSANALVVHHPQAKYFVV